jgi:riboflavin kinase/FMN adenylyltransferase
MAWLRARGGPVLLDGAVVSSSRVREALKAGDCTTAAALLTRPFAIRGVVQHGDKVGRTINFPTANLSMGKYLRPAYGIYAVKGACATGANCWRGQCRHPPHVRSAQGTAGAALLRFSGDLYGQELEVSFHHFLRPEAKFDSLDALVAQMARDCLEARRLLESA